MNKTNDKDNNNNWGLSRFNQQKPLQQIIKIKKKINLLLETF